MKALLAIVLIVLSIFLFAGCYNNIHPNHKDLDDNMLDLMMYHDNLGQYLREGKQDEASWLLEGMDSCLKVISAGFPTHRKLRAPFEKYYQKELEMPIKGIRAALTKKDFPAAISAYQVLTNNCNGCHADHDIDKEVIDWSDSSIH